MPHAGRAGRVKLLYPWQSTNEDRTPWRAPKPVGGVMSDCMHCEINELVQRRIEGGGADIAELASMIVESLADLILLAPASDQSKLMADALAQFGHTFLEKSGAVEPDPSTARH
jgi:hypothetical protein